MSSPVINNFAPKSPQTTSGPILFSLQIPIFLKALSLAPYKRKIGGATKHISSGVARKRLKTEQVYVLGEKVFTAYSLEKVIRDSGT